MFPHIHRSESQDVICVFRIHMHTRMQKQTTTLFISQIYTDSLPKRKCMKISSHQGFYISVLFTKYACHLQTYRYIHTYYIYIIYTWMYFSKVIKVIRLKTCIHLILNAVAISSSKLSCDHYEKCYLLSVYVIATFIAQYKI